MKSSRFSCIEHTALITGGGGLLGQEHAFALAEVGAKVAVTDINFTAAQRVATLINADYGEGKACALEMDVTDQKSIVASRERLERMAWSIDILINNATVDPKVSASETKMGGQFEDFSLQAWRWELEVALTGAFLCSQVFGRDMCRRKGGVILNIASDLSVIAPNQTLYHVEGLRNEEQPAKPVTYSVIKTGLLGLTRYLAAYWAERNVRVNALSPGGIYVDQPAEFVKRIQKLIPMGRMANRDEYRGAVQFLCSEASSYLTGQNIVIDGGRTIL